MPSLHLIAHNIRSAENVGSLLRTADSIGIEKVWITGYSPTPEHRKVNKTALGAQAVVAWEQVIELEEVLRRLRSEDFHILGLELDPSAKDLVNYQAPQKIALLLGNEREGLPPSLRRQCDELISIQQQGMKESLNVSIAAAIASFWLLNRG